MTIGLIFKRMRREWRSLSILLLAVCLLTGFFALGPFYVRAVTDVGLRHELDNAARQDKQISIIVDNEPLTPESYQVVRDELGDLGVSSRFYIRAEYTPPTTEEGLANIALAGRATGGYVYRFGQDVHRDGATALDAAFQPFAFDDMPGLFNLIEGRWPVRLPTPEQVDPTGLSDEEQQARFVGPYNRGQVEVIVTTTVAERAKLELGSRLVLGNLMPDHSGNVASVVVVGIVEPKNPNDPFWQGNRNFLDGADVEMALGQFRYDYGMATIPEAYTDWLRAVTPGSSYIYVIDTDTDVITADNAPDIKQHLQLLRNRLNVYHPGLNVLSGLTGILENFSDNVSDTEGPIIWLSAAILLIMLYHLINTVALVLEQQGTEWSTVVSRGGSIPQLMMLQILTVGVLGLIGVAAGPILSILFLRMLEHFGPMSSAMGGTTLSATRIPTISLILSGVAGAAAVIVLTVPGLPAALRSLLRLKQLASRPPVRPSWARYHLDLVLIAAGGAFVFRMYYLIVRNIDFIITDSGARVKPADANLRELLDVVNNKLAQPETLDDPFNLFGPALMLTGIALLWLRLFPWMVGLMARFAQRSRRLTAPLAMWNVARDPGHYAQLVLLLIGTLALGTASLGLSSTRDWGAWNTARAETGGSARVELNPAVLDAESVNWDRLPGVDHSVQVMHVEASTETSRRPVHIVGLDAAEIESFAGLDDAAKPLHDVELPPAPGLELPADAWRLSVQVYSLPPENPEDPATAVQLTAYIQDSVGVPYRINLSQPGTTAIAPTTSEDITNTVVPATAQHEWLTFDGAVPVQGRPPYRLMRIGINSLAGNLDAFQHTIYLDRIATQDAFGTSKPLDSFETEDNTWTEATVANPYAGSWASDANMSRVRGVVITRSSGEVAPLDGATVLRLDYQMGRMGGRQREPSIVVNPPDIGRIPVVINATFANQFAGTGSYQTAADQPLKVGDIKNVVLNLGTGSVEIGFVVVGVIEDIPSIPQSDPVLITDGPLIQPVINQAAVSNNFFAPNEIWLDLPDRKPGSDLKNEIAQLPGVSSVSWAWDRYGDILREPLPSAVAGMLYAGFWISLALSLLDFAFYLIITAKQRSFTFGVLRSLGWNAGYIWRLLFIEQVVLITPALIIGSLIGIGLALILMPFLSLVGGNSLHLPLLSLFGLLLTLVVSFTILMGIAAVFLRRMSVNQVLRLGEE